MEYRFYEKNSNVNNNEGIETSEEKLVLETVNGNRDNTIEEKECDALSSNRDFEAMTTKQEYMNSEEGKLIGIPKSVVKDPVDNVAKVVSHEPVKETESHIVEDKSDQSHGQSNSSLTENESTSEQKTQLCCEGQNVDDPRGDLSTLTGDEEPDEKTKSLLEQSDEKIVQNADVENQKTEEISIRRGKQHKDCILEPLNFPEKRDETKQERSIEVQKGPVLLSNNIFESGFGLHETPCMLCDNVYSDVGKKEEHDEYLCHLVVEHKLVIADVKLVSDLRRYAIYWKKRFSGNLLQDFCAIIKTNCSPKDIHESEKYFLLCDALPEDRKVREKLQLEKLKELVDQQTEERNNDNLERMCLFCTKFFIGNRSELFNHMNEDHNFNVGHPHNLIHIEEFLNVIEKKLSNLECLYCEKLFRDRVLLREHMRKKSHRRLNPKNKIYDKYYIINYLEFGKNWEILQGEPDQLDNPEDWEGWDEDAQSAVCFFCSKSFSTRDQVYEHMKNAHDFDFVFLRKDMNLSFYQQIKMINFIRREVHQAKEADGDVEVKGRAEEKDELATANDMARKIKDSILTSTKWNQPQYYFPTYENDALLCQLDDKEGLFEPEDTFIIGEDGIDCKAIINESVLTDLVVNGYFD